MENMNFLIVGVGGQGTVLSGDVLAEVGLNAGYDAKKSDILGLAIRSGSVISHVRWADKVNSPMSMKGSVDYLVAFEPLESLRLLDFLKPDSTIIVNQYKIPPAAVATGQVQYPSKEELEKFQNGAAKKVYRLEATAAAQKIGSVKAVNIFLMGVLASRLPVDKKAWIDAINKFAPKKFLDLNIKAFEAGMTAIQGN